MAFKISKKRVMEMSKAEVLAHFELCVVASVKEENFGRGTSITTAKSYELLKERLLDLMDSDETYGGESNDFTITAR